MYRCKTKWSLQWMRFQYVRWTKTSVLGTRGTSKSREWQPDRETTKWSLCFWFRCHINMTVVKLNESLSKTPTTCWLDQCTMQTSWNMWQSEAPLGQAMKCAVTFHQNAHISIGLFSCRYRFYASWYLMLVSLMNLITYTFCSDSWNGIFSLLIVIFPMQIFQKKNIYDSEVLKLWNLIIPRYKYRPHYIWTVRLILRHQHKHIKDK